MSVAETGGAAFDSIIGLVTAETGLMVGPNRRWWADDRIRRAMRRHGISDPAEYLRRLGKAGALDDLASELAVGETYFFRDPGQFEFIRREVLPDIRGRRRVGHRMRVWSAGCASGEEAYSLAILFEQEGLGLQSEMLGTDISHAALAKARKGEYGAWSFRGDPFGPMESYFHPRGNGFAVAARLAERIIWRHLNLAASSYPSTANGTADLDLIVCRNVLIYFEPKTARTVQGRLITALAEGGWLVLGASDPPMPATDDCETLVTKAGIFYRRRLRAIAGGAVAAFALESAVPAHAASPNGMPDLEVPPPEAEIAFASPVGVAGPMARPHHGRRAAPVASDPIDPQGWALRVQALANGGDSLAAERAAAKAAARYPLVPELHHLRAILLLGLGHVEEAAAAAKRVIYLDRTLAFGHVTLAMILQLLGLTAESTRSYRNARKLLAQQAPDALVPLSDGLNAGPLAEAVSAQLSLLNGIGSEAHG